MSIVRAVNVVPLEGKPPLFTVFVITLDLWVDRRPDLFPVLDTTLRQELPTDPMKAVRVDASLRGEEVSLLTVRRRGDNKHTVEYQQLLRDLGKPSSADRETYDCNEMGEAKSPSTAGAKNQNDAVS